MPLAHDVSGKGEPLLLIHGLGSSRRAFDLIAPDLSEHFTVYAVDLPGHGESPMPIGESGRSTRELTPQDLAAAVAGFMAEQGLDSAHLAGNSLGGWVSLELAADGLARSVTGLCPAGLWRPITRRDPTITMNMRMARLARPAVPLLLTVSPLRRLVFLSGCEVLPDYQIAVDAARAQADAVGCEAAHDGMLNRRFERADQIPATVPVTIIFGDRDRLLPAPRNQMRELTPEHAEWEILWRCGHAPMWDAPARSAEAIRRTAAAAGSQ